MRRIKKNKISKYTLVGIIYIVILLTICTAYSFFSEDLSLRSATDSTQSRKDYTINYIETLNQKGKSISSYGYNITLAYLGNSTKTNWEVNLKIPFDTEITECYHTTSCIVENKTLTIKNKDTTNELSPNNNSTSFGIKFKTSDPKYTLEIENVKFTEK